MIIVEEIKGDRTYVDRAQQFDRDVNERIHPSISMPVYGYCTSAGMIAFAVQAPYSTIDFPREKRSTAS